MRRAGMALLVSVSVMIGLTLGWRLNRIVPEKIIDDCFDTQGIYSVLEERDGASRLLRFSPDGVLLGETMLTASSGGARVQYKALTTDTLGNLYVLCETYRQLSAADGREERLVLSEDVWMYDATLTSQRSVLRLEHTGGAERAAIQKLEAWRETLYVICERDGWLEVLAADAAAGDAPYSLTAFPLPEGMALYDAAVAGDGTVLYTTMRGGLYTAVDGRSTKMSAILSSAAVPADFALDDSGLVCFLERLSGKYYRWNGEQAEALPKPMEQQPRNLRNSVFPSLITGVALCTLAAGILLYGGCKLISLMRRRAGLLPTLLLQMGALCTLSAFFLALMLTAFSVAPARAVLSEKLAAVADEAVTALRVRGIGGVDLVASRGTALETALADCLKQMERRLKDEGLDCMLTLYDSRRQQWFNALSGSGGENFVQVTNENISKACGSALNEKPVVLEERQEDAFLILLSVPTAGNSAVLEVRTGYGRTMGAELWQKFLQSGACALLFAAVIWVGGVLLLCRGLRPLKYLRENLLALAGEEAASAGRSELERLAVTAGRAARRHAEELTVRSAQGEVSLTPVQQELLSLADGQSRTPKLCTAYAALGGSEAEHDFKRVGMRLDRLCSIVQKNGGIVASCSEKAILALFPGGTRDGIQTVIEFRESLRAESAETKLHTVVDVGTVAVGLIGGTVLAVSEGISRSKRLASTMPEHGVECLVTERALTVLDEEPPPKARFVGYTMDAAGVPLRLYELLDGMTYHRRRLLLTTRERFEEGAEAFAKGDFTHARECFAAAVGVDRGDRAILFYLKKCGEADSAGWNIIF